jgi:hypothetical protein
MDAVIFAIRYEASRKYLSSLEESQLWNWEEKCSIYHSGKLLIYEAMVLIHPRFYENLDPSWDPRGKRSFEREVKTDATICQSTLLWNYDCELSSVFHGDHLWPQSLGGPTIASNKALLCEMHNRCKGSDIHNYPWELGLPEWYNGILERIRLFRKRFV